MTTIDSQSAGIAEKSPRNRILDAAERIIARSGTEAATTRAVAAEAGVQAPTIYRFFGDKDGLLDAVAEHAMITYVAQKSLRIPDPDAVEEMRAGWDAHVEFALAHPGIFRIMAARPGPIRDTPAMQRGLEVLRGKIRVLALAGRLKMPEPRALDLFHAMATGTILTLLRQDAGERDMRLSEKAREAAISALTGETTDDFAGDDRAAATALRVRLPKIDCLSGGERLLLSELLDRIADV